MLRRRLPLNFWSSNSPSSSRCSPSHHSVPANTITPTLTSIADSMAARCLFHSKAKDPTFSGLFPDPALYHASWVAGKRFGLRAVGGVETTATPHVRPPILVKRGNFTSGGGGHGASTGGGGGHGASAAVGRPLPGEGMTEFQKEVLLNFSKIAERDTSWEKRFLFYGLLIGCVGSAGGATTVYETIEKNRKIPEKEAEKEMAKSEQEAEKEMAKSDQVKFKNELFSRLDKMHVQLEKLVESMTKA